MILTWTKKALPQLKIIKDDKLSDNDDGDDKTGDDDEDHAEIIEDNELDTNVMLDIVGEQTIVALYSLPPSLPPPPPPHALELFYLCKVIKVKVAEETMIDSFNHVVEQGAKYFRCQYLEKDKEKRGFVCYKNLIAEVFVYQVMSFYLQCPWIMIIKLHVQNTNLSLTAYKTSGLHLSLNTHFFSIV